MDFGTHLGFWDRSLEGALDTISVLEQIYVVGRFLDFGSVFDSDFGQNWVRIGFETVLDWLKIMGQIRAFELDLDFGTGLGFWVRF